MTRIMGDSTTFGDIPTTVQVAAFYGTGLYAVHPQQVEARFPRARYGWCDIDVNGSAPHCSVRDWETGDKSGSLEQWVIAHNKASGKKDAVVYCNKSTIGEVRKLTGSQILGVDYWLWVATLDGTVYNQPGTAACQVKGAGLTGGHWDESLVFSGSLWLPVAPLAPPKPPAPPKPVTSALKVKMEGLAGELVAAIAQMS